MSETSEQRLLTPPQRKLVGFALGLFALVASITLLVGVLVVLSFVVGHFSGVLWPLAVAGIMALIMRPVVELLETRLKLKRLSAVITLYGAFVLVLAGAALLITPPLVEQVLAFIAYVPEFWKQAIEYVQQHYPQWIELAHKQLENDTVKSAVDGLLAEAKEMTKHAIPSLKSAGHGVMGIFGFFAHLAVVPIYLFFFLLSRGEPTKNMEKQLPFLKPSVRDDVVFLVREFISIVVSFFRGQLVIGLIMGAMLAIGFSVVGLKFGLIIGLVLGILNIVPYLGTIIGLSIALPLALLQPEGGMPLVGLVLLVFIIVQNIEGWYLTPKIMSDRTGLHPVAIIVSIFFWGTALSGILGMVLAIPLTAFFVTAWRLVKRKYFKPAHPVKKEA
ncbi:AI-2E family transporter [Rariglobus hedericola]|uniref:AI-2E family transporter n=1 Tax=Rariglobus hedericola TaxID=2597822 RepID=A0A556QNA8_9BACT|nr:AI-2E family transporter [Rariglobus hedericola]TSJ78138.1 AI-2E family transporter [Rariglobus hedericola]